jgi:deazaflavin-dependent oxidoreductase (nitroreductase family)
METYRRARPIHRLARRTAATRLMAKIYGVLQQPLDRLVYRLTRGRTTASSWLGGVKITMLTATGARSGQVRTLPVLALPEGDNMILIASNFGRPRNPSWYYNLRANPRATIVYDGVTREVEAHELSGAERERCYQRGEDMYPGFIYYRRWAANREIPVLRLTTPAADRL